MFAKASAKQTTTTAIKKETLSDAPTTKKLENFESENSPGKENRINVEIEVKKEDSKKIEVSKNSDESSNLKEKPKDNKSVKSSRIDSRNNKKRSNASKTSETQAKRRKRIQVIKLYYSFIQRMFYGDPMYALICLLIIYIIIFRLCLTQSLMKKTKMRKMKKPRHHHRLLR